MADFTLPANSKITSGDHYPAPDGAENVRVFQIYRWSPDDDANPRVDRFEVDLDECGPMGSGRTDQDQERAGQQPDIPPLLSRRDLRVLFDEY